MPLVNLCVLGPGAALIEEAALENLSDDKEASERDRDRDRDPGSAKGEDATEESAAAAAIAAVSADKVVSARVEGASVTTICCSSMGVLPV